MPDSDIKEQHNFLAKGLLFCVFLTIVSSFYFFFFKKDYDFVMETACDPSKEMCLQRDCTNPDNCPPNGLATFKRYSIKASDFKYCENENCDKACVSWQIKCTPIRCESDSTAGEICTPPAVTEDLVNN